MIPDSVRESGKVAYERLSYEPFSDWARGVTRLGFLLRKGRESGGGGGGGGGREEDWARVATRLGLLVRKWTRRGGGGGGAGGMVVRG